MEQTSLGISLRQMRLDMGGIAWARAGVSSAFFDKIKMKRTEGHLSPLQAPLGCFLSVSLDVFKPSSFPSLPITISCLNFPFLHQAPKSDAARGRGLSARWSWLLPAVGFWGKSCQRTPPVETGPCRQWWVHPGHCWILSSQEGIRAGVGPALSAGLWAALAIGTWRLKRESQDRAVSSHRASHGLPHSPQLI